jgi:hypothetical protein
LNSFEFEFYHTTAARDNSGGLPVSPHRPLFRRWSCATSNRRGRAAAGQAMPPDRRAGPTPRAPRRRVAAHGPSPTPHHVTYKVCLSPLTPPPFPSAPNYDRLSTPPLNTMTPSRGCSSTGTLSPLRDCVREPPTPPHQPLPVSQHYTPLLHLISLPHLPRHPRATGPHHHR